MEVWAIGVYNEDEPMGYDAIEMFAEALDLNLPVLADNGNASHDPASSAWQHMQRRLEPCACVLVFAFVLIYV